MEAIQNPVRKRPQAPLTDILRKENADYLLVRQLRNAGILLPCSRVIENLSQRRSQLWHSRGLGDSAGNDRSFVGSSIVLK